MEIADVFKGSIGNWAAFSTVKRCEGHGMYSQNTIVAVVDTNGVYVEGVLEVHEPYGKDTPDLIQQANTKLVCAALPMLTGYISIITAVERIPYAQRTEFQSIVTPISARAVS